MTNKNLRLIFLILFMASVFTGVFFILTKFNLFYGSLAVFLLIVALTVVLLREMIEQKYDLLSDLPAQGQTVNAFQLVAFGKAIWQYPPEGPFIFNFNEGLEKEPGVATASDVLSPSTNNLKLPGKDGYEMEVHLFSRSNRGRKSDRTDEEWDALAKEYLALGNLEKQAAFCQRHHIGSPRTFRNHVRKYKEKKRN